MRTRIISSHIFILLLASLLFLAACGQGTIGQSAGSTPTGSVAPALDVNGTPIVFPQTAPQKIISLAPSTSEILGALQLQGRVVAVDYYTNYPEVLAKKQKISDVSGKFNIEAIVALHPDLILSSGAIGKQYNVQLKELGLNLVVLPSPGFTQTLEHIQLVGRLTFAEEAARKVVQQMQQQIDDIKAKVAGATPPKVLLEADSSVPGKPYVFGGGSFGDEMLQYANATNIFHNNTSNGGYPQVTDEAIIAVNPQFIILTEDPQYGGMPELVYKRPNWGNIDAVKSRKVYHIKTDLMQRPGPRLTQGLRCMAQIMHPTKFSEPLPDYCETKV